MGGNPPKFPRYLLGFNGNKIWVWRFVIVTFNLAHLRSYRENKIFETSGDNAKPPFRGLNN